MTPTLLSLVVELAALVVAVLVVVGSLVGGHTRAVGVGLVLLVAYEGFWRWDGARLMYRWARSRR